MTYGLPAVAVTGGGASESIRNDENGFVVANDPDVFGETVLRILKEERLYAKLSEGATRTVRAYTTTDMAQQVLAVYRSAIAQHDHREESKDLVPV